MTEFKSLFENFVIIGLLVFGLFAFIIGFQTENNAESKFTDNPLIGNAFSDLGTDLGGLDDESQAQKTLFETENPTSGFGTILLFSIVSSGKVFNSMIVGIFNIIVKLPTVFLGMDPIITAVLSTLILFAIIMGLWSIYKLGSG